MIKKTKFNKVVEAVLFVLSAVLAAGVMTVFRACAAKDDGTYMNCHNAQLTVFWIAVGMTAAAVIMIFFKNRKMLICLQFLYAAAAVAAALVPQTIIHMCMMNDMRCQAVLRPTVIVICVIAAVVSVLHLILVVRENSGK